VSGNVIRPAKADVVMFTLSLDQLNDERATFTGHNGTSATVDRAAWEHEARPLRITLVLCEVDVTVTP